MLGPIAYHLHEARSAKYICVFTLHLQSLVKLFSLRCIITRDAAYKKTPDATDPCGSSSKYRWIVDGGPVDLLPGNAACETKLLFSQ